MLISVVTAPPAVLHDPKPVKEAVPLFDLGDPVILDQVPILLWEAY